MLLRACCCFGASNALSLLSTKLRSCLGGLVFLAARAQSCRQPTRRTAWSRCIWIFDFFLVFRFFGRPSRKAPCGHAILDLLRFSFLFYFYFLPRRMVRHRSATERSGRVYPNSRSQKSGAAAQNFRHDQPCGSIRVLPTSLRLSQTHAISQKTCLNVSVSTHRKQKPLARARRIIVNKSKCLWSSE